MAKPHDLEICIDLLKSLHFLEIREMICHFISIRMPNIRELYNSLCHPGLGQEGKGTHMLLIFLSW